MTNLKIGDRVEFYNTASAELDGNIGTILGTGAVHFPTTVFIVGEFAKPLTSRPDVAICIIEHCIKPVSSLNK